MMDHPGLRSMQNVTKLVQPKNVTELKTVTRFGGVLGEQLSELIQGVDYLGPSTSFKIISRRTLEEEHLQTQLVQDNIDKILVMYSYVQTLITNTVQESYKGKVLKVHSTQGQEFDNIMVLLHADKNGNWGLNGDQKYLISAVTRAKLSVTIYIVSDRMAALNPTKLS